MKPLSPKHTKAVRDLQNQNGLIIPNLGLFVVSGSTDVIIGSATRIVAITLDALAVKVKRVEIFHSGAAANFNFRMENSTPNTGNFFDPRSVIVCYETVPGSNDYSGGVDQIEDLVGLTDTTPGSDGQLYLKFMPYGSGNNTFKYLIFFEGAILYVNYDNRY